MLLRDQDPLLIESPAFEQIQLAVLALGWEHPALSPFLHCLAWPAHSLPPFLAPLRGSLLASSFVPLARSLAPYCGILADVIARALVHLSRDGLGWEVHVLPSSFVLFVV